MYWKQRKLLSQNFLHDRELVKRLIRNSSIGKIDTVLEIGPGTGIITEELLCKAGRVIAVELDARFYNKIKTRLYGYRNLELYNSDILTFTLPTHPYKVFSNIPFRLTSDIIRKLLTSSNPPLDSYLIIQKEAAEKLMKNSLLSLLYQPYFRFSTDHWFQKSDFVPVPKVETALLRIYKRRNPLIAEKDKGLYKDFITYVFSQKKPHIINLSDKPTKIDLSQWIELFHYFLLIRNPVKLSQIKGSATKLSSEQQKLQKIHRTRNDKNWKKFGGNDQF